jgi:putative transposase
MGKTLFWPVGFLVAGLKERRVLALENLAVRQPLAVQKGSNPRPQLRSSDRCFWAGLSQVWEAWRQTLVIVKPETVVRWHRRGVRLFRKWISRRDPSGWPATSPQVRALILKMAAANPLLKVGIDISERTASRLMPRRRKPPSQNWRTFLDDLVHALKPFWLMPEVRVQAENDAGESRL